MASALSVVVGYLLDTNHCSKILKNDPVVRQRFSAIDPRLVYTCIIVQGELYYMVKRSNQPVMNRRNVDGFLMSMAVLGIDQRTAEIYGDLKADLMNFFGPKSARKARNFKFRQTGISENDLWIAAIAVRNGLTIVSQDADFIKMQQAGISLSVVSWI